MKQEEKLGQSYIAPISENHLSGHPGELKLLEQLPIAVYYTDLSGVIMYSNNKAAALWGRAPGYGELAKDLWDGFTFYDGRGKVLDYKQLPFFTSFEKSGTGEVELCIKAPNGCEKNIVVSHYLLKDNDSSGKRIVFYINDISEHKQVQTQLERRNLELRDYIDNAAIGLHWVDAKGIILWANKAEMDLLGYAANEYIGHHISEFHVDQDKINDILSRLSCDETLRGYESTLRCKDGSIKTVYISSNVFRENGKFIHTRCFTIDITEQKKLFEGIKNSELRYRSLLETLQIAIYTTDAEGRITFYNKAAVELWGRAPNPGKDKWCGPYRVFKDGKEVEADKCPMAVALKEGRSTGREEIEIIRPDGVKRSLAVYPVPIFDEGNKVVGAINIQVDITDRKRSEDALKESEHQLRQITLLLEKKVEERTSELFKKNEELKKSEERYHKMIEEVEDYAIVLLDKNGIIQNWNKGAEKIKGYSEEDILGRSFSIFYRDVDRNAKLPETLLQRARDYGKAIHEGWRKRKDGSLFWGSIVITALHDAQHNIIGFSKVTRDLTERKIAEDKMRDYATQLEFQNKELEQFAYAASHDMKEPLRKISFYNNYVVDNANNLLDDRSKEYLNRSLLAVKRMSMLIDDLLSYSRANSQNDPYEETDLTECVEEIILSQKDLIEQNEVSIHLEQLPVVKVIPFQFKQLIDNLINNSIKYKSPERKCVINIFSEQVKGDEIDAREAESTMLYHKITVQDNGLGFEPEYANKIFEIFQRLNNNSSYKGTGIGLAICKRIVQNHHGFIKAYGKENEGARFDIYLPAQ
ncbi:MAG TPA: PAS domain S-box protein [Flavisolibacter sp.]|nr:PAS domain S-box protein [Flavisolibacter sp.]